MKEATYATTVGARLLYQCGGGITRHHRRHLKPKPHRRCRTPKHSELLSSTNSNGSATAFFNGVKNKTKKWCRQAANGGARLRPYSFTKRMYGVPLISDACVCNLDNGQVVRLRYVVNILVPVASADKILRGDSSQIDTGGLARCRTFS